MSRESDVSQTSKELGAARACGDAAEDAAPVGRAPLEKHTPGPWTLETLPTSCGVCHKVGPFPWKSGKENHACVYVDYPNRDGSGTFEAELLANARLMAASPELLEVVRRVVALGRNPEAVPEAEWTPEERELMGLAEGALRKAEGAS